MVAQLQLHLRLLGVGHNQFNLPGAKEIAGIDYTRRRSKNPVLDSALY